MGSGRPRVTAFNPTMLRLHNINDTECPEFAPYRSMRKMSDQLGQGLFVAEGLKVVTRLLETDFNIHSLLLTQHWFDSLREKLEKRQESMDVFITDKKGIALYNERNFNISVINALKIGYISGYKLGIKANDTK